MKDQGKQSNNRRREEILNISAKMFVKKGIHKTSMRDIAAELDMTAAGLYYSVKSKQDIIDSIGALAIASAWNLEVLRQSLGNVSLAEVLVHCIRYLIESVNIRHDHVMFLHREFRSFSPMLQQSMMQGIRDLIRFFEDLLKEGSETGEFRVTNPTMVAFQVWVFENEWILRHWFWKDLLSPEEYADQVAEVILKQVQPPLSSSESTGSRQEGSSVVTDD